MENIINKLSEACKRKEVTIFCGAGISLNSGLPTAYNFLKEIFDKIEMKEFVGPNLIIDSFPFEFLVELMLRYSENDSILKLFANESLSPNLNHIFFVKLLLNGYSNRICTVNFDLLLEKAIVSEGRKVDILYTNYSHIDKDLAIPQIIKLHGSSHDIDSMKITLKSIASKSGALNVKEAVKHIFSPCKKQIIVVMGYSCSDYFDIVPAISDIAKSNAEILFVQHINASFNKINISKVDNIGKNKNPFKGFLGDYIEVNTDKFINSWWNALFSNAPVVKSAPYNWRNELRGFVECLEDVRHKLLGTICFQLGNYEKTLQIYEKAIKICRKRDKPFIYNQLALVNNITNNPLKSNEYEHLAYITAVEQGDKFIQANIWELRAEKEITECNYQEALNCYKKELPLRMEIKENIEKVHQGMGVVYMHLNDIEESLRQTKIALTLAEENNDLWIQSDLHNNLGEIYNKKQEYKLSKSHLERAITIKLQIGDKPNLFFSYLTLGTVHKNTRELIDAKIMYQKALDLAVNNNFAEHIPTVKYQLGVYYMLPEINDLQNAIMYLEESASEFKDMDETLGFGLARSQSAQIYEHFSKAAGKQAISILINNRYDNIQTVKSLIENQSLTITEKITLDLDDLESEAEKLQALISSEMNTSNSGFAFSRLSSLYLKLAQYHISEAYESLRIGNPSFASKLLNKYPMKATGM